MSFYWPGLSDNEDGGTGMTENAATEESDVKCLKCGEKWRMTIKGNLCLCKKCGNEWSIAATMKIPQLTDEQLAEFEKLKQQGGTISTVDNYIAPLPCKHVKDLDMRKCTFKQFFQKIEEELDELKCAIFWEARLSLDQNCVGYDIYPQEKERIASEAADVITSITTMLEAIGIDSYMRNSAQQRVNEHNRERGRL